MSEYVVISKELRDNGVKALERFKEECPSIAYLWTELLEALRAAPETVSVEGVDEFMASRQFHTMGDYELLEQHTAQDFVDLIHLVSDLRRLVASVQPEQRGVTVVGDEYYLIRHAVNMDSDESMSDPLSEDEIQTVHAIREYLKTIAPVQPSAVVSREAVDLGDWSEIIEADGTDENGRNIRESWVKKVEADEVIYQLSIQLPKPQTVGRVDFSGIKDAYKDGWNDAIENLHDDEAEEWAWDRVGLYLAHLQAPTESEVKL